MPQHARGQLKLSSGEVWTTTAPNEGRLRDTAQAWGAEVVSVEVRTRRTDPFGTGRVTQVEEEEPAEEEWAREVEVATVGVRGGELKYVGGR